MQNNDYDYEEPWDEPAYPEPNGRWGFDPAQAGWWENIRDVWQWDDIAAEVGQESQARVALIGLAGAGKHRLFNRLRGWDHTMIADKLEHPAQPNEWQPNGADGGTIAIQVESYGFFVLADLPTSQPITVGTGESLLLQLADPALVVYLLDAAQGVQSADYRWIATLRAAGKPLVVALNKADLIQQPETAVSAATKQLGMPVIPISAYTGLHIEDKLLPAWLDAVPRLAVPLGRELHHLRRTAARRVIRQAAVLASMMGVQPLPLVDLPFQAMLQVSVVMRIGAAYGQVPTGGLNRELMSTVISTLGIRYLGWNLVKLIPFLGWAISGTLSGATTLLIGESAIRYYESDGSVSLRQWVHRYRSAWQQRWHKQHWITAVSRNNPHTLPPQKEEPS